MWVCLSEREKQANAYLQVLLWQERQAAEKLRLETELLQQEKAQLEADRLLLQAQQAETDHLRLERERLIQARQEEQHKVDVLRREREELELQALQSRQGREQEQEQLLEQQRAEHQRLQSEAAQLRIEQEQVELERFKLEEEHAKFERLQQEEEAMRSEYNRLSQSLQAESDRTAKERARLKREAEEVERERARLEQERLSNQQLRQELEQQEHPQPETESQLKTKQPDSSKTDEDARWEAFLARQRVKEAAVKKGITIRPPRQSTKIAATRPRRDSASPSPGQQGASTSQTQGAKEDMGRPSLIARPTSRERLRPASPHTSTPTATERAVRSSMTGSPLSVDCGVRATPSSYMLQLVDASTDASGAVDHTDTSAGTRVPVSSIPRLLQNSKGRLSPRGSFSLKAANATDLQTVQNLRKSRLAQQTAADVVRYAAATDARSKSVTALLKVGFRLTDFVCDISCWKIPGVCWGGNSYEYTECTFTRVCFLCHRLSTEFHKQNMMWRFTSPVTMSTPSLSTVREQDMHKCPSVDCDSLIRYRIFCCGPPNQTDFESWTTSRVQTGWLAS